jgi:hypothetical protein
MPYAAIVSNIPVIHTHTHSHTHTLTHKHTYTHSHTHTHTHTNCTLFRIHTTTMNNNFFTSRNYLSTYLQLMIITNHIILKKGKKWGVKKSLTIA